MTAPAADVIEIDQPQAPPLRTLKPLGINDLVIAESRRVVHHVVLSHDQNLDDALCADFWQIAAKKLHRRDLIEVEPADKSFWALLLVQEVSPDHAKVALLQKIELPSLLPSSLDGLPKNHGVTYLGPARRWAAMRQNQILKHSFATKEEAARWLLESAHG